MTNKNIFRTCATAFLLAVSICAATGQEKPAVSKPAQVAQTAQTAQAAQTAQTAEDSAPSVPPEVTSPTQPVLAQRYPRYLLRPSDVLQIAFPISPEFDQTIAIQPDGYVSLREVGDLYIAGKTLPEFSAALHKLYGNFLNDPVINVEMKDFEKPYFTAGGEFGKPGKYELRGDTTVAEAVAIAGGFTDKAKHSEVLVFHHVPGGWEPAKRLDVKQMIAKGDLGEDIHVRPGDLIYVPKSKFAKIKDIKDLIPTSGMGFAIP
jgi:polysaccharide export outer membrane protein